MEQQRRKRKKKKRKKKRSPVVGVIYIVIGVLLIFIACSIGKVGDDDSAADASTVASTVEESAPAADTVEYGSVVRPDGSIKVVSDSVDRMNLYYTEYLQPWLLENYHDHYKMTKYSNDMVVTIWDDDIASDVDALRAGNKDAIDAWSTLRDAIMEASETMTYQLRGYVPGANVAIVLVDARNHNDVLFVASNGYLMYDVDLDGDSDPWMLYQNYNEEIKDRKPDL